MSSGLPRSRALTSALILTSVRTENSGLPLVEERTATIRGANITRLEYWSRLGLRFSIGGAWNSARGCATSGAEALLAAPTSVVVDACASCSACATSMTKVRDPVLGMRLRRRGGRGEGWACDRRGEDGGDIEGPGRGWANPTGESTSRGSEGVESDDPTPINPCPFHRSVSCLLVGGRLLSCVGSSA